MNKTAQEWAEVKAAEVTEGSVTQATNVLQMALDDIAALAAADRRVWKALGIETFAQAGLKEASEFVADLRAERDKAVAHAMEYGPRIAAAQVLLTAAYDMAYASHVIAGTPELKALRDAIVMADAADA